MQSHQNRYLSKRIRELFLDGKWIANTNYKEQLSEINFQVATTQLVKLNTIAHLVFHIDYYLAGLLQVLNGGDLTIKDRFSFDLPPIASEEDWRGLANRLLTNAGLFAEAVEAVDDDQLSNVFVDAKYGSYQRNIDGVIEHSYYHLGQIVLLKKLISSSK